MKTSQWLPDMPQYLFKTRKNCVLVELILTVEQLMRLKRADGSWRLPDGRIADRDFGAEHGGQKCGENPGWPMVCEAAGVQPRQRQEAQDFAAAHGVPTKYTGSGDPIIESRGHYKKFLKMKGLVNKDDY